MTARRIILLLLAAAAVAAGLWTADFLLARPGRIAAAARESEMLSVRDQILRFESETGGLPGTLDELVPGRLRRDQVSAPAAAEPMAGKPDGSPLYLYDPARRRLAQTEPSVVTGFVTRKLDAVVMILPPTQSQAKRPPEPGAQVAAQNPPPAEATPPSTHVEAPPEVPVPPAPPARRDPFESGVIVAPKGPELPAPPAGALVFEAEQFTDTNYGWEVRRESDCSGGAYLHSKEGIANGPGQTGPSKVGYFYQVGDVREMTYLRYHFHLAEAGSFYVYGRMWTTDTHCSNSVCVAFDGGGPYSPSMENRDPFRWLWSSYGANPVSLAAGDHFMHVFIHEDGVRFDEFILSPSRLGAGPGAKGAGGDALKANFTPGEGTQWRAGDGPPVNLSFDLKSMVLAEEPRPECSLVMRRLRPAQGTAALKVVLREAGEDGRDLVLADEEIELSRLGEVCFMPLDLGRLKVKELPRREYLLEAEAASGGRTLASARVPLIRPYAWEACGPLEHLGLDSRGPLDGDTDAAPEGAPKWSPLRESQMDHFGVLDFGLFTSGNSLFPAQMKTIYARTRVKVPETGKYLIKVQSDDQMLLWLDGREILRWEGLEPVTRTAVRLRGELTAGEHRIRMRVNQFEGRWQACLRIRTEADGPSRVTGIEPAGPPRE